MPVSLLNDIRVMLVDALAFLAKAYRKLGNDKDALKSYEKVLELVPSNYEAKQFVR